MKPSRRTLILFTALAGTLAATAWVSGNDDEVVAPVERPYRSGSAQSEYGKSAQEAEMPELQLAALDTRGLDDMKTDLFPVKSWYVPPPSPPRAPAKPIAPPLPFTYIGRMIEDDGTAVFVTEQDRNRILRVGDVIDHVWRVDAIETSRMKFTYLPLNETKYLALGAGS